MSVPGASRRAVRWSEGNAVVLDVWTPVRHRDAPEGKRLGLGLAALPTGSVDLLHRRFIAGDS